MSKELRDNLSIHTGEYTGRPAIATCTSYTGIFVEKLGQAPGEVLWIFLGRGVPLRF